MSYKIRYPIYLIGIFCLTIITLAQSAACPALVQSAIQSTAALCAATNTNEACYGNTYLEAQFLPEFALAETTFTMPGDRVQIAALQSLRLSPMNLQNGTWGMSLLEVQVNLRESGSNYTILLFGDVIVENAGSTTTTTEVTATQNLNIHLLPATTSTIITTLQGGEILLATGRLADNSWIRISVNTLHGDVMDGTGWIYAPLLHSPADFSELSIVESTALHYQPMQAFFFETGASNTADCSEAPRNGILIQTPAGNGRIRLMVNGVDIDLNVASTAHLTAQRNGILEINVLQGGGAVTASGVTQPIFTGTTVSVPLNPDLKPRGAPSELTPYDVEEIQSLPTTNLPRQVVVNQPLTSEEIIQAEFALEQAEMQSYLVSYPNTRIYPDPTATPTPTLTDSPNISIPETDNTTPSSDTQVQQSDTVIVPPAAEPIIPTSTGGGKHDHDHNHDDDD